MPQDQTMAKQFAPSVQRNRDDILTVPARVLPCGRWSWSSLMDVRFYVDAETDEPHSVSEEEVEDGAGNNDDGPQVSPWVEGRITRCCSGRRPPRRRCAPESLARQGHVEC